jgi:hypothetical protein
MAGLIVPRAPPENEIITFLKDFGYGMDAYKEGRFVRDVIGARNTFFMT